MIVGMMGMTQGQQGHVGTMWKSVRPSETRGDHEDHSHGDHMGTTWGLWGRLWGQRDDTGRCGDHRDHGGQHVEEDTRETIRGAPRRPQRWVTTWGPSGSYGDDVGMTGTTQGQCGDNRDDMGTTCRRDHGVNKNH